MLLCVLAMPAAAAAAAATGSISGVVKEAGSEEELAGIEVCAYPFSEESEFVCGTTDLDGTYLLEGLEPGEFEVEFWGREFGYATQFYDHEAFWWEADPVEVESETTTTGIDADLAEEASISGTVRSASTGAGLEVEACAWSTVLEGGWCTVSEPDGHYAIGGLVPGTYKVEFFPFETFDIQFWDHKTTWEAADELALEAGDLVADINGDLLGGPSPAPPAAIPPVAPPVATPVKPKPKRCKKGFRKKRVHGKVRCVKKKKRKHRHQHVHGRPPVWDRATFRLGR